MENNIVDFQEAKNQRELQKLKDWIKEIVDTHPRVANILEKCFSTDVEEFDD